MLLTVDPDGTERILIDPMALDPSGLTTLDAWQPSKEGDLLAYQLSEGGTEESVVRVMDVVTGEHRRRPDRPRALLPDRLAAGRRGLLLRAPAGARARARRRGAVPPAGVAAPGRHRPRRGRPGLRRGPQGHRVLRRLGLPRRSLAAGLRGRGHGAAQRPLARRPPGRAASRRPTWSRSRSTSTRRPGSRSAATAASTSSPTATPRAAGSASRTPPTSSASTGATCSPRTPSAVLDGFAVLDGAELERPGPARVVDPARGLRGAPCTTWRPATRARRRAAAGLGQRRRHRRAARGRPRGVVRLHRPHDAVDRAALRRPHRRDRRPWATAPGHRRRAGGRRPSRSPTPRPTAPPVRMFVSSAPTSTTGARADRGRRSSTATAASASR